jgi:hypothetical protein
MVNLRARSGMPQNMIYTPAHRTTSPKENQNHPLNLFSLGPLVCTDTVFEALLAHSKSNIRSAETVRSKCLDTLLA